MKKKSAKTDELNVYYSTINKVLASRKRTEALNRLCKNILEYEDLCKVADGIADKIKPIDFTIYGTPTPKKIYELGKCDTLYKPLSVENEINWILLSIRKYSKLLSLFIIQKKEFENNFLNGNYEKANNILETIFLESGYSIWYIEAKFLLLEYQNKSGDQKEFLSELLENNKNGIASTISHFLSYRTERNLSAYKYDSDINSIFKLNNKVQENEAREYYLFRLNFYENYKLNNYSTFLLFENSNSIIDRYLLTKDILKVLSLEKNKSTFVSKKATYIYRKTNDKSLLPIIYFNNPTATYKEYYNSDYLKILDLFYAGFYEEAIIESKNFLKYNSSSFDIIIIYIKCFINLNKNIEKLTYEPNSLLNQLCTKVFDLLSGNNVRKELLYNLYQINKNLLSFEIAPYLDFFLKKEQNLQFNKYLKLLSINSFDPYFSSVYPKKDNAIVYLNTASKHFPSSVSIKHKINYINNEISDETKISKELFNIDRAKILFNEQKYNESITEWSEVINKFPNNTPILQTALKYFFDCLIFVGEINESIKLYVDNYLLNPNSVNKINTLDLLDHLRKIRYKGIKRTIDLPIFVSLASNDDAEKSFILEQFCQIYNSTRPSETINKVINESRAKNEIFYNTVCNSETLKHSIYINNTIERLTERLHIINHLIENFPEKLKNYQDELNLISNELIIYEGTQKLEESKIYANDQAIINNELNEIEGLFNRYKTIYKLTLQNKKILLISPMSFSYLKYDGKEKYNETEIKYTDSALSEVFHELFDSILDKYLFSKFGIVAYLSTRIRHGVLLGEIRPEIEMRNLILNRVGNSNSYEESKFWNQIKFGLNSSQRHKLHEILAKFSLNIDTLIEDIIRERIQIKLNGKNPNGLFNYEFDKNELLAYALQLGVESDVKAFSQKIIDIIWSRTDANLEVIRAYINTDIKTKFSTEINALERELMNYHFNYNLPQIFTNLTECNIIIENKINKISSWFRRSGSSINDFNIEKLFDIVWSNTERCYPKVSVECHISLSVNPTIRSNYYIHFTDLFRILLDNMFKYGAFESGKKEFYFNTEGNENTILCRFKNLKEEGTSTIPLKSNNGELIIDTLKLNSENKSGISKAIKIVKFDLGDENNFIRVINDDPEYFNIEVIINTGILIKNEKDIDC